MSFHIHPARTAPEIQIATRLITAYSAALGVDLTYQDFSTEIESMPGKYAPPHGEILLAIDGNRRSDHSDGPHDQESQNQCNPASRTDDEKEAEEEEAEAEEDDVISRVLGCVALRPLPGPVSPSPSLSPSQPQYLQTCCELKRLYVLPSARGRGVGRALLHSIIAVAREKGYKEMRLDTLHDMHGAMALYRETGFVEIEAYYDTPVGGTVFFALEL